MSTEVERPTVTRPSTLWPVLVVLAAVAVGVIYMVTWHWRRGAMMVGGAMLLAGILRAFLPNSQAGLLVLRHRWTDVAVCVGMGIAIVVLALVVPPSRS